jgi:hypothetical protein
VQDISFKQKEIKKTEWPQSQSSFKEYKNVYHCRESNRISSALQLEAKPTIPTELCLLLSKEIMLPVADRSTPVLGPTQPPIQPVLQDVLSGVKRPGRESNPVLKKIIHEYKPPLPRVFSWVLLQA